MTISSVQAARGLHGDGGVPRARHAFDQDEVRAYLRQGRLLAVRSKQRCLGHDVFRGSRAWLIDPAISGVPSDCPARRPRQRHTPRVDFLAQRLETGMSQAARQAPKVLVVRIAERA